MEVLPDLISDYWFPYDWLYNTLINSEKLSWVQRCSKSAPPKEIASATIPTASPTYTAPHSSPSTSRSFASRNRFSTLPRGWPNLTLHVGTSRLLMFPSSKLHTIVTDGCCCRRRASVAISSVVSTQVNSATPMSNSSRSSKDLLP